MKTKLPLVLLALLTTGVITACSDRPYAISHSTVSDKDYDECKTEAYQAVKKPISEPPRLYRRVNYLSQATLSDSLRLS